MSRRLLLHIPSLIVALVTHGLALPAMAQTPPSSAKMVDALESVFGAHPHSRANHAKGLLLNAVFTPAPAAASISRAPHFTGAPTPVLVRFSNFGGIPDIADADPGAAPYGMSLKFMLANDSETDLVMHSFNGFPSATAAEFVDFLIAMGKSPAGSPRPTPLERYADSHAPAKAFLAAPKPVPSSFIAQSYFAVNTFKFTDGAGAISYGRYRMVPVEAPLHVTAPLSPPPAVDVLRSELRERLSKGPVSMRLLLQIGAPTDDMDNPSVAWPETRRLVELGSLSITGVTEHGEQREQTVVFLPDELPDGIEPQDPMIGARTRAYTESLARRLK